MQYKINKDKSRDFLSKIIDNFEVIAPVKCDDTKTISRSRFAPISTPEEIYMEDSTFFPVKNYFFDKKETLFNFDGNKITDPTIKLPERVFFGLRRCDLNGIRHQDIVFLEEHTDPFYKARRDSSILIGFHCNDAPNEYCFCGSVENIDFFDLMIYDKGDIYAIEVGSEKGDGFIQGFKQFFEESEGLISDSDKEIKNLKKHLNTTDIKDLYNNKGWEKIADTCLSCGACNHLCPNCHCFTIQDVVNFDLKSGKRVRVPAACQMKSFTRVAGDHIFRETRVSRFKHRIYHQIQYFKERHDTLFCTGCGRCISGCPVRIDWVDTINELSR